ncbi:MAG: RpiB/LacA/LacB family sugar-phosphate isomerase [Blastocatellia bacterium]|nr:RpiB/LacA/LacB family sugar-phosphate isomerase [Blastocatellia bacterium]
MVLGFNHAGFALKGKLKARSIESGGEVRDVGIFDERPIDDLDIAYGVARAVSRQEIAHGILLNRAGIGSGIAVNKLLDTCFDR